MMRIEHIFVSPAHNFFGHHGQPPGQHPTVEVDAVECLAGQGLRGDRFFGFKDDYKGQITFFAMEVFEALRRELQLPDAHPSATRRNIFTRGADLHALVGEEFEVQGVRFAGIEECRPCHWMNVALGPGAEDWLKGRGGLRARILSSGVLRRDAPASAPGRPGPPAEDLGQDAQATAGHGHLARDLRQDAPATLPKGNG